MEVSAEKKTIYELAFVLKVGESVDSLAAFLKENGAEIVTDGPVSQVQLAYPINKATAGLFSYYRITLQDVSKLKEMTTTLGLKESVLRFLFVKVPKEKPRPVRELKPVLAKAVDKKVSSSASARGGPVGVTQLDSLSNEKLEQTLEEILK